MKRKILSHPLLLSVCMIVLLSSCGSPDSRDVIITVKLDDPIISKNGFVSDSISTFLFSHQVESGTMVFSELIVERIDLDQSSDSLKVPLSSANEVRKSLNIYDLDNREVDYKENISKIPQIELLNTESGSRIVRVPEELELNQLVLTTRTEDGINKFKSLKTLKERIITLIDSSNQELVEYEVFYLIDGPSVPAETPDQGDSLKKEKENVSEGNRNAKENKIPKEKSPPTPAHLQTQYVGIKWDKGTNKVSWNKIKGADKIYISIREINGNSKAYTKKFEVNPNVNMYSIPSGKGSDATYKYTIEITAYDADGNPFTKLIDYRKDDIRIDCN